MMALLLAIGIGIPGRVRRLASPEAAYLPGHHRPFALLVCGQSLHLQHGPAAFGRRADPLVADGSLADYADPVPQALVLTAIVIGFATTALFLSCCWRPGA